MSFRPKRSTFRNRYDDMMVTLKNEIITKIWEVDSYLPSENDLADRFQLSKNSVRKGLDLLVAEGYIEKIPRIGNRVLKAPTGITLKFGYYFSMISETRLNEYIEEFHSQYPHIRIQVMPLPLSHSNPSMKDYIESESIDVMSINNQDFELFADSNNEPDLLEPLEVAEGIYPILTEPFIHGEKVYVQPFTFSPIILGYNKKHFQEKELLEPDSSWTWETVKKAARQLAIGKERYGFFFHMLSDNRWPIFLLQNNIVFNRTKENGDTLELDHASLKESLQMLIDLREEVFPPFLSENDQDVEMLFRQEKVSMILTSYFFLNQIADVDFPIEISPVPYLGTPKTLTLIIGLAINKNSKHKQAAQTFIDFMLSYDSQLKLRQNTLSIPSLKSAAEWNGRVHITQPERYFIYREIFPTFSYHTELNVAYLELINIRQKLKLYISEMEELHVFS